MDEKNEQAIAWKLAESKSTEYDALDDIEWDKVMSKLSGHKIPTQMIVRDYSHSPKAKAIRLARKFIGFELKPSYFSVACDNLDDAVRLHDDGDVDLLNFHEQEVTA